MFGIILNIAYGYMIVGIIFTWIFAEVGHYQAKTENKTFRQLCHDEVAKQFEEHGITFNAEMILGMVALTWLLVLAVYFYQKK